MSRGDWEGGERKSSKNNAEISAWELGVKQGIEIGEKNAYTQVINEFFGQLRKKLVKAMKTSEKLWKFMGENEVNPLGLYMKANMSGAFVAMFVLKPQDIKDLDGKGIYLKKFELTDDLSKKDFDLDVVFVPYSDSFDFERVENDGFTFTYKKSSIHPS